ncbi:hypothetical protein V7793_02635 [Streptomyces sp. KLMMK]|uniref:hypothetical protein n=1 Tax=Streptomyces sp. KLMMK TaxID=3109353 RepID=UPI002FFE5CEB
MTGRRGEKPAGHHKAVPRDMQDQQADAAPGRDRATPASSRGSKNAGKAEGAGGADQRTDRTGDLKPPKADEPPD